MLATKKRHLLAAWPAGQRRELTPRARLGFDLSRLGPPDLTDRLALAEAGRLADRLADVRASGLTGTWSELIWSNSADFSTVSNFAVETSLLGGLNDQPVIPALFFHNKLGRYRTVTLLGRGVLSNTGTPTITFGVRLGTTSGSAYLSGTSVGVSSAITMANGITNKLFEVRLDLTCYTPGLGTGNTTLSGAGWVTSPGGFAAPYIFPLEPTTPDTAAWTSTIDGSLTQYVNLSATFGAASASNAVTLKQLFLFGWN